MDQFLPNHFDKIEMDDAMLRYESFQFLMKETAHPVNWAYDVWDSLFRKLQHKNNHVRAIAAQLLSNLAKSDPKQRMLKYIDKLIVVTKDERFVTARHSLQSLWKVAVVNKALQEAVISRLTERYNDCTNEKNGTLTRYDIIQVFRKTYDIIRDEALKTQALKLIEGEADIRYRKKYAGLWKDIQTKKK